MATPKPVTEPAAPAAGHRVTEPVAAVHPAAPGMVYVYDTRSGAKISRPVPVSWLDGRFSHLAEVPSKKKGA